MRVSILILCKELSKITVDHFITDPRAKAILKAFIESVQQTSQNLDQVNQKLDQIAEQTSHANRKLDQMIDAPYKTALRLLREIDIIGSTRKQANVEKALDQFRYASEVAVTATAKAQSLFYVGVCYSLLNEPKAALEYYEEAYQTGWDYWLKSLKPTFQSDSHSTLRAVQAGRDPVLDAFVSGASLAVYRAVRIRDSLSGKIRKPADIRTNPAGIGIGDGVMNGVTSAADAVARAPFVLLELPSFLWSKKKRRERDELSPSQQRTVEELHIFYENFLLPLGDLLVNSTR